LIRILHTGDLHLGREYQKQAQENPEIAKRYKNARMDALNNVINLANENECDYLVIAGDLFDTHTVTAAFVKTVCDELSKCLCTILVLPGNHDYCEHDDKLWERFKNYAGDRILTLDECRPVVLSDAILYPCPCSDRRSENNALAWLKVHTKRDSDLPNIGIAHGAIEGLSYDIEQRYYYMSRNELESLNMDLWLIGHTHVPYPSDEQITGHRIFNAGTHQQTDIADNSEGSVFLIELDDNKKVSAKRIHTGVIRFARTNHTLAHGESIANLLEGLKREYPAATTSLRLFLDGVALAEDYERRCELYEAAGESFLRLEVIDRDLQKEITEEMIDAETLEGSLENQLLKRYLNNPELLNLAYGLIRECKEAG